MTAPLTDRDYAEIRARVHAQLTRERRQRVAWRVAAAAAILAAALLLRAPHVTFPEDAPRVTTATFPDAPGSATARALDAAQTAGTVPTAPETAAAISPETPRRRSRAASHPIAAVKRDAPQPSPPQPLRLEIETADPDVRIIWIINPSTEETL